MARKKIRQANAIFISWQTAREELDQNTKPKATIVTKNAVVESCCGHGMTLNVVLLYINFLRIDSTFYSSFSIFSHSSLLLLLFFLDTILSFTLNEIFVKIPIQ